MTEPEPKRGCSRPFRLRCRSAQRAATRRCRAVEGQSPLGRARRTRAAMSRSPARGGRISRAKCARRVRPRSWPRSGKSRPAPLQPTHRQAGLPRYSERKGCSSSPRARHSPSQNTQEVKLAFLAKWCSKVLQLSPSTRFLRIQLISKSPPEGRVRR